MHSVERRRFLDISSLTQLPVRRASFLNLSSFVGACRAPVRLSLPVIRLSAVLRGAVLARITARCRISRLRNVPRAGRARTASPHIAAINPPSTCIVTLDSKRAFLVTATYLDQDPDSCYDTRTLLQIARSPLSRVVSSRTCIAVS